MGRKSVLNMDSKRQLTTGNCAFRLKSHCLVIASDIFNPELKRNGCFYIFPLTLVVCVH